jgi:hypothetical protein
VKQSHLHYCYGIVGHGTPAHGALVAGLVNGVGGGGPLFAVEVGGLVAAVSEVPADAFDERALDRVMKDIELVGALAVQHSNAVHELFLAGPAVVPLSLGAVYRGREGVEELLRRSAPLFGQLLNRFQNREEWGLKAFGDQARLEDAAAADSIRLRELAHEAERSTPGKGFFLRKRQERARGEEATGFVRRTMTEAFRTLASISAEAQIDDIGEVTATDQFTLLFKAAFLVDRDRAEAFRDRAEGVRRKLAGMGIDLQVSGPWAPYSFAKGGERANLVAG